MLRGGPLLPNNHEKKRKRSSNELMIENHKKKPSCSLCFGRKHRANRCQLLERHNAWMVQPTNVQKMAAMLGNPLYFEVHHPDLEKRQLIDQWLVGGNSNEIPEDACHLVLVNMHFCQMSDQSFQHNIVEVKVLGSGGEQLFGYERAFFTVHRVNSWMRKHCAAKGTKKHILSTLRSRTADQHVAMESLSFL
jgi:hypothetical protein